MRNRAISGWVVVMALGVSVTGQAVMEKRWEWTAADEQKGTPPANMSFVDDAAAAGGRAVAVTYLPHGRGVPNWQAKGLTLAGPVTMQVTLRVEGMVGIEETPRMASYLIDIATGVRHEGVTLAQAVRAGGPGYVTISYPISILSLPAEPATYDLSQVMWSSGWGGIVNTDAVVYVSALALYANGDGAAYLSGVEADRTTYRLGQPVTAHLSVHNPTAEPFAGTVVVEERFGLDGAVARGSHDVSAAPGSVERVTVTWPAEGPEAGRELVAVLQDRAGQALDQGNTYYGVANDPSLLQTVPTYTEETQNRGYHNALYVGAATPKAVRFCIDYYRSRYMQRNEYFSWCYSELVQMVPPANEEPYIGNEGRWWQSLKKFKKAIRQERVYGIVPITYLGGPAWGPAAYDLVQRHPDWFVYGRSGALGGSYDMENRANYQRRAEFDFVHFTRPMLYAVFDPTRDDVRHHIADQIVGTAKEMGFEGARWDVWSMEVSPNSYRLDGSPIAKDGAEADRLSAESIAALKELVAKELPTFTWGYNYGAPEENVQRPLMFAEKCRGGGWLLDEIICRYHENTSPFHVWEAYLPRLVEWGDHVRKLGGIYNPYALNRQGGKYPVDRLYEGIIRLIAGGRGDNIYENEAGLVGRIGLMAMRYSNTFSGWNLDLQPADQELVHVEAPDTLWWKRLVLKNVSLDGRPQLVVHLVNSPAVAEIQENPTSVVRPAVEGVTVRAAAVDGKLPRRAWMVAAEPMRAGKEPTVQALPLALANENGAAQVTVPWVRFWKTVVFEY
ncbi:MAG: hypothetical protein HQ523_11345 [Lentisphaerae bacterium]|nr:hypothetical protein [Lentisphaerota bacterium]